MKDYEAAVERFNDMSKETLLQWLMMKAIIRQYCRCVHCDTNMKLKPSLGAIDGFEWRCQYNKCAHRNTTKSIRAGSVLENLKMEVKKILQILLYWAADLQQVEILRQIKVTKPTFMKVKRILQSRIKLYFDMNPVKLGGSNTYCQIVEIKQEHSNRVQDVNPDAIRFKRKPKKSKEPNGEAKKPNLEYFGPNLELQHNVETQNLSPEAMKKLIETSEISFENVEQLMATQGPILKNVEQFLKTQETNPDYTEQMMETQEANPEAGTEFDMGNDIQADADNNIETDVNNGMEEEMDNEMDNDTVNRNGTDIVNTETNAANNTKSDLTAVLETNSEANMENRTEANIETDSDPKIDINLEIQKLLKKNQEPAPKITSWYLIIVDTSFTPAVGYCEIVPNLTPSTLAPVIERVVQPGTIIWSDPWQNYGDTLLTHPDFPFPTLTDRYHFFNPRNDIHLETVRTYHSQLQSKIKAMKGIAETERPHFLREVMWRERHSTNAIHAIFQLIKLQGPSPPTS